MNNNPYDIVSITIKTKPRNERRSLLSRLTLQLWLLVNVQSMLVKSEMLASAQEANGTKVEEIVVTLNMQHRVNTNNKAISTTEEQ